MSSHVGAPFRSLRRPAGCILGLVVAAFCAACTTPTPVTRARRGIIGGTPVAAGEYQEVVGVLTSDGFCSGTVIAPRVVLTAAHCVFSESGSELAASAFSVFVGNTLPSSGAGQYQVSARYRHPQYDNSSSDFRQAHDVAVLVATQDIPVTPVPILPLAQVSQATVGTNVLIEGFGDIDNTGNVYGTKYYGRTPIAEMTALDFIAGKQGKPDTCYGDSGGPAYFEQGTSRWVLGITSAGSNPNTDLCGDGTIFTLAPAFIDWIASQVGPILDGGTPGLDGGTPGLDGGTPGLDGGTPGLDGGAPGLDGGAKIDAAAAADAGSPGSTDAGRTADGGAHQVDASGSGSGGGGTDQAGSSGGCALSGTGSALASGWPLLLLTLACRRRRPASARERSRRLRPRTRCWCAW
jgi:V8-like Glu-specific endopeptidase